MVTLVSVLRTEARPDLFYTDASNRERGDEPAPSWLLDGLLPHGATAIISDPGAGKSMIIQQVLHHLCYGRPLGSWPAPAPGSYRALVLDLEGDATLNRDRSYAITPFGDLDQDGRRHKREDHWIFYQHQVIPPHLAEAYGVYREQADAHLAYLDDMLTDHTAAADPIHLVVIDTLSKFLGARPQGANAYTWEADKVGQLNRLGTKHQCAIVLIHHTNKLGQVSGSQGIAGSCTVAAKLELTDEKMSDDRLGVLRSIKVRNGAPFHYPMRQDPDDGTWIFLDDMTAAQAGNVGQKRLILDALARGPLSLKELAARVNIGKHLKNILTRLLRAAEIRNRFGRWEIAPGRGTQCPGPAHVQPELSEPEATPPAPESTVDDEGTETQQVNGFRMLQDSINASRMKPILRIRQEDREQQPWSLVNERMTGEHRWWPLLDVDGQARIAVYDRRGSYPSAMSSVPVAANTLLHSGPLDYRRNDQAGLFLVDEILWPETGIGHPLGRITMTPGPWWITTPHMILLEKLAAAGRIPRPRVLDSWTGRRTDGLFTAFSKQVKAARAAARDDPDQFLQVKRTTSIAIRCLWPKGARSPFWRPDWSVAVRAEAAVRLWIRGEQVARGGVQLAGIGGVDELAVIVPSGIDPTGWAPAPLKLGHEYGEVDQKRLISAADWTAQKHSDAVR